VLTQIAVDTRWTLAGMAVDACAAILTRDATGDYINRRTELLIEHDKKKNVLKLEVNSQRRVFLMRLTYFKHFQGDWESREVVSFAPLAA